jgi:DNA-binding protein YbaB
MANEFAKAHMAEVMAAFDDQMALVADLQKRRTQLVASGTARGKRVTVTVNADGTVIETKFTADLSDLSYAELARAMTEAAQQAAAELARKRTELMRPLTEARARLPKLTEITEGMPDLTPRIPSAPEVSLAPPNSPKRLAAEGKLPATAEPQRNGNGVTENGWSRTDAERLPGTFAAAEEPAQRRHGEITESGW